MVTQLKMTKTIMKNLFLTKVAKENIIPYQQHIDDIFSDPKSYFNTEYYSNKVVIGRKDNIIKNSPISSPGLSHSSTNKSRRNSLISKTVLNQYSMYKSQHLPSNKYYISDTDVNNIYERFKEVKERNASMSQTFRNKGGTMGNKFPLTFYNNFHQQNALEKYNQYERDNKIVIDHVAQKAKKSKRDLLMKNINLFRIKKELIDKSSDNLYKRRQQQQEGNLFNWILNLKNKNDQHYIDAGTKQNPKWHIILTKKNKSEIIRDVKDDDDDDDVNKEEEMPNMKRRHKPVVFTESNRNSPSSLSGRRLNSTLMKFQLNADSLRYKGLIVKGNDLLNMEYSNFKKMKRRKIITKMHKSDDHNESDIVFVDNHKDYSAMSF